MNKGITLLETLVVLIIIVILTALALPLYRNALESSRLTEVVLLWGRQKNFATGYNFSPEQAQRTTENIRKANLKYFTGEIICREKATPQELCWEIQFTRLGNSAVRYQVLTDKNFTRLMCIGLNSAGKDFCESRSRQETPDKIDGKDAYWIH